MTYKNISHFAKEILFENELNIITGTSGSGKTELCRFLFDICKKDEIPAYFLEDDDYANISIPDLDIMTSEFDVVFLNDSTLGNGITDLKEKREFYKDIRSLCLRNNCTVFITVQVFQNVSNVPSLVTMKATAYPLAFAADTIMHILKVNTNKLPWLLRLLHKIFKFKLPNAQIKFLKNRKTNNGELVNITTLTVETQY